MKTDELIRALAADKEVPAAPGRSLALALVAGAAVAAVAFAATLGLRRDVLDALATVRFPFKFVVTLAVVIAGVRLTAALARPGADLRGALRALLAPALLIGAAVAIELAVVPASEWGRYLVGSSVAICLTWIPLLAIAPLAALLLALRQAAPTELARAGAAAGFAAAGIAATLYAAHCIDDSPLFVAAWYSVATALVVALGAWLGPRVLRW